MLIRSLEGIWTRRSGVRNARNRESGKRPRPDRSRKFLLFVRELPQSLGNGQANAREPQRNRSQQSKIDDSRDTANKRAAHPSVPDPEAGGGLRWVPTDVAGGKLTHVEQFDCIVAELQSEFELLLDQSKFDSWFGSGVSPDARKKHVGKRVMELAIQYLPTRMLHDYCTDQAAGKSHADGDVYAGFQWYGYTLTELEWQHRLWSRMDAKIASMGGCDHIDLPTFGPHRHR